MWWGRVGGGTVLSQAVEENEGVVRWQSKNMDGSRTRYGRVVITFQLGIVCTPNNDDEQFIVILYFHYIGRKL